MQALRTGCLAQGASRAVRGGSRASTGRGWYQRYQRMGPDAFRKARAPNAFDWDETAVAATSGDGQETDRRRRRRAFFDMGVDGVAIGRVEFELAADLLPVTCENFLRLCNGVDAVPSPRVRLSAGGDEGAEESEDEQEAAKLGYEGSAVSQLVGPEFWLRKWVDITYEIDMLNVHNGMAALLICRPTFASVRLYE